MPTIDTHLSVHLL